MTSIDKEVAAVQWFINYYQVHPFLTVLAWLLIGYVFGQLTCIEQRLYDPSSYRPTLAFGDLYGMRVLLSLLGPVCVYMFIVMNLFQPKFYATIFRIIAKPFTYLPGIEYITKLVPDKDKVLIK